MKIINYSLFTFILIFFLVSFFYKPKEDRFEKKFETPYEFAEVNLNIPIEKDISTQGDVSSIIDISLPQVNFTRLWTVKVNTYSSLENLEVDLKKLKDQGYKVYSKFDEDNEDTYFLLIGPTLKKSDSESIADALRTSFKYKPTVEVYD
tara:strand:+ start:325 stop:771 length:447 start_codon:yes stop_codon:yes gene_type:complete